MLEPLREAVKRGAQVICVNPLKERGLERFQHPQNPIEMLTNGDRPINTAYFRPALGGDMALLRGMAKNLLQWEREAQLTYEPTVFDHDFLNEHTGGVLDYLAAVDKTPWDQIVEQSGLPLTDIEQAARMYAKGKNVIMCWAMGITQHRHSVATIQEIANLMLLRGNVGRPGAGLCPVRGHSNVQGDRTMGINERPAAFFLDALERRFQFKVPRENGHNVVDAIHAMLDRRSKVFIGLGGNFAQATPDSTRTFQALSNCDLTVQISTKLNRSHLAHGKEALILPCLGRTDIDVQTEGPQAVTVEDSFSMVHASNGQLQPLSRQMRSEPSIIAGIAAATLGAHPVDWNWVVADYSRIRELIADTIPGFKDFNQRIKNPGGFYLGSTAAERLWSTPSGRANFRANVLPVDLVHERTRATGVLPDLIMQSMRSHDQYNTTVYGLDDRYRGVKGQRDVLFVNEADIIRLGFKPGQKADIVSIWDDGRERRVKGFTLLAFDIPAGQAAAYYPEVNPLVPLESTGDGSQTPTSKFIAIRLEAARDNGLIMAKSA
jgi:molybdopterin-dependent oxidoreductase alpha subunit